MAMGDFSQADRLDQMRDRTAFGLRSLFHAERALTI
jgi:hypothetical protein